MWVAAAIVVCVAILAQTARYALDLLLARQERVELAKARAELRAELGELRERLKSQEAKMDRLQLQGASRR